MSMALTATRIGPVSPPKPKPPPAAPTDRRSGQDRRKSDNGPPAGKRDRRRNIEPRQPEVVELQLTESQWGALGKDD